MAANSMDAPLGVVVSELLVPVMKRFWSEKLARLDNGTIRESPVPPERKVNTVQPVAFLSSLGVLLEVPRISFFSEVLNLSKGERPQASRVAEVIPKCLV